MTPQQDILEPTLSEALMQAGAATIRLNKAQAIAEDLVAEVRRLHSGIRQIIEEGDSPVAQQLRALIGEELAPEQSAAVKDQPSG